MGGANSIGAYNRSRVRMKMKNTTVSTKALDAACSPGVIGCLTATPATQLALLKVEYKHTQAI